MALRMQKGSKGDWPLHTRSSFGRLHEGSTSSRYFRTGGQAFRGQGSERLGTGGDQCGMGQGVSGIRWERVRALGGRWGSGGAVTRIAIAKKKHPPDGECWKITVRMSGSSSKFSKIKCLMVPLYPFSDYFFPNQRVSTSSCRSMRKIHP